MLSAFNPEIELSIIEMCAFSILISDKGYPNYLMRLFGIDTINRHLTNIGINDTKVTTGFSDEDLEFHRRENTSTADDIAKFFKHLYHNKETKEDL